jgi:hypothetical protein
LAWISDRRSGFNFGVAVAPGKTHPTPTAFDDAVSARPPSVSIRAFPKVIFRDADARIGEASTASHGGGLLKS